MKNKYIVFGELAVYIFLLLAVDFFIKKSMDTQDNAYMVINKGIHLLSGLGGFLICYLNFKVKG